MKKKLLILVFLISIPLFSQEEIRKEVIKGKYKGKIEEKKPEFELQYDIFEVVRTFGHRGTHIYDEELKQQSEIASTPLPELSSDQVRRPWLSEIEEPPLAVFHPLYGEDVEKWELVITDAVGNVFRTFSGKGKPPRNVRWNGENRNGEMIDVGTDYSYYVKAVDQLGNTSRILGKKIRIPGLYWKKDLNYIVRVDGRIVFTENTSAFTRTGQKLLLEASDYVRKDINKRLRVVVYSRNEELSVTRARKIADYLLDRIIVPPGVVTSIAGYKSVGKDKTNRVDIIIR